MLVSALWTANAVQAQVPGNPVANQQLADQIANQLRASGTTSGADIDIVAINGNVELNGSVKDAGQRAQIERVVQGVQGVNGPVRNNLVSQDGTPSQLPTFTGSPLTINNPGSMPYPSGPVMGGPVMGGPMMGGPMMGGPMMGGVSDPTPLAPPSMPQYGMNAPKLPPYAWPTYAPHNNYSRVAYPEKYPYNAWPYIGPFYPFPKVPLGWRKVTLEWEDGHWFYGRIASPHDYWRVRYQ